MSAEPAARVTGWRRFRPRRSLRSTLAVTFAAVALAVVILLGLLSYSLTARAMRTEVDRSLTTVAATLAGGGELPASGPDRVRDPGRPGLPADQQGLVQAAQWVSADGEVTAILGPELPVDDRVRGLLTAAAGTQLMQDVRVGKDRYRLLTQSLGAEQGVVQVARNLAESERLASSLANRTIWLGLLVAAAASGIGWVIAWRITRRLTAITDAAEKVAQTGTLAADIDLKGHDEVSRLGTAMQRMLDELARAREDQQRLVQDAGHELRTPLTSLRTNLSVLRRFDELPPSSRDRLLDDVESESRELTTLVNELIELATDRRSFDAPEPLDLPALAEQVAERFRRRTGREITVTERATAENLAAVPSAVARAISNLLDNALKFDTAGGPVEVEIDGATVSVADSGPGISPEDLPRIFDRFHRSAQARALPGSGLGLAIVREVAQRHGGTVFASNRPGGGAVIGFTLGAPRDRASD